MAIIGVKNCTFTVGSTTYSVGKVTNISVAFNRTQLSALQMNKTIITGATVALVTDGSYDNAMFEQSGTLTWQTIEMNNNVKSVVQNTLSNVVLYTPDISAVSKTDTITMTTFSINGSSWNCTGVSRVEVS